MNAPATVASSELVLGGQRSGKSARAEALAQTWLALAPEHQAVLIATARGDDAEMQARIARHQADRARALPRLRCVEVAFDLAAAMDTLSQENTLVLVDCLTLWLANWLMPAEPLRASAQHRAAGDGLADAVDALVQALARARGPLVLVSNEIGLGVVPLGASVRAYVDALGRLNQAVAQGCSRVTLMVAGQPLCIKGAA